MPTVGLLCACTRTWPTHRAGEVWRNPLVAAVAPLTPQACGRGPAVAAPERNAEDEKNDAPWRNTVQLCKAVGAGRRQTTRAPSPAEP